MEGLEPEEEEQEFEFAEDLVRYIDREWKGWFCVGVAGTSRDPSSYNREKRLIMEPHLRRLSYPAR
jgi:5,10-methylenetetrahydrofolate reductase